MEVKQGIPVSPGVAIERAFVLDSEDQPVPRRTIPASAVPEQLERLHDALDVSREQISEERSIAEAKIGAELAEVFDFHIRMLQDKYLVSQFEQVIEQERVCAEFAVYVIMRRQAKIFREMENRLLSERVADIWDLEKRILAQLIGRVQEQLAELDHDAILIAHDLTPSQTAALDRTKIKGIAIDAGGRTSHSAIMAHALGIPAVVGTENVTAGVATGDQIIIDGHSGKVLINPDAATLMDYRQRAERLRTIESSYDEQASLPAITKDGTEITVRANIEFPEEIETALAKGATGIGLYRTEFLYLADESEPTEDEQYAAYCRAIDALGGRLLTIRTVDLGADKLGPASLLAMPGAPVEHNPFLGVRSIRLCLQNVPMFKTQLRAILRASARGPIRIMFPLISSLLELQQAKMILDDVKEDLQYEEIPYGKDIPVGIMIEVPSAALQASVLAKEADFFSIGTNDLIQYTVAVDRSNERIASLYSGFHPAVIKLIKESVRAAKGQNIDIGLCGEMAGQIEFVPLLLGLGPRNLSMTPPAIPEVKKVIRSVTLEQCQKIARKVNSLETDRQVQAHLLHQIRQILPEAFEDGKR